MKNDLKMTDLVVAMLIIAVASMVSFSFVTCSRHQCISQCGNAECRKACE